MPESLVGNKEKNSTNPLPEALEGSNSPSNLRWLPEPQPLEKQPQLPEVVDFGLFVKASTPSIPR